MVYAKPTAESTKRNAALQERKALRGKGETITETEVAKVASKEERWVCMICASCAGRLSTLCVALNSCIAEPSPGNKSTTMCPLQAACAACCMTSTVMSSPEL